MQWRTVLELAASRLVAALLGAALALAADVGLLDAQIGRAAQQAFSGSSSFSPARAP